ncbi:endonuclease VIII [Luteimonas sp. RD2P54]|uniref:DNA-(apurinic or apyrimidinic site) lyase n=1 Tax=Luteimonas endophytica TaxID=3042023 RepID=A0ABT6J8N1_9GAMM|nr:endonuclease VIII [Luteimonas endophytica]MDH5823173.1 endonuclease VIII [Luteimonas endophytica]
MPEGPEIRRAADRLAAAMVGQPLVSAWFAFPALKRHQRALRGRVVAAIEPRGKALLTRFDNGWTLYTHNQLYGVWRVAGRGERPESGRSLRVALETAARAILLYSASDVAMWRTAELAAHPFLARIGPDVLDPALDAAAVEARLRDPRFARRRLAGLLLDQAFLAGMGNYLRAEVLFEAGIAAGRAPAGLDPAERRRLAIALLAVPARSYRTRGIAPAAGMRADYLTDTADGFRFRVFDRAGLPCETCGTPIERSEAGGRRLYFCPRCQV